MKSKTIKFPYTITSSNNWKNARHVNASLNIYEVVVQVNEGTKRYSNSKEIYQSEVCEFINLSSELDGSHRLPKDYPTFSTFKELTYDWTIEVEVRTVFGFKYYFDSEILIGKKLRQIVIYPSFLD